MGCNDPQAGRPARHRCDDRGRAAGAVVDGVTAYNATEGGSVSLAARTHRIGPICCAILALWAAPVHAGDGYRWIPGTETGARSSSAVYGLPDSDDFIVSFDCGTRPGSIRVMAGLPTRGVARRQRSTITLRGLRSIAVPAKGAYSEVSGAIELNGETIGVRDIAALADAPSLTVAVPGSVATVPVTPAGRRALRRMAERC